MVLVKKITLDYELNFLKTTIFKGNTKNTMSVILTKVSKKTS